MIWISFVDMKAFEDCIMERVKMDLIPQKFTSDWSTFSHKNASHAQDWLTKVKQIYEPFCLLVHVRTIKCLIVKANKIKKSWFHVILIGVLKWPITQSFLTISSSLPAITLWLLSTKLFLITSWNTHMWSFCHFMYHVSLLTDVPFTFSLCNGVCITLWLATLSIIHVNFILNKTL